MKLSETDRRMLDGDLGEAARFAMSVLTRMAEVYGATELMDVSQAHIDGCGLLSAASLEFAETLASKGAKVRIPTTLNMGPLDLQNWREFDVPEEFARRAIRQGRAYEGMGCIPTWTCAPYQGYLTPRFGQQIAWAESNAVVYANSVLGARTNRYGDYIDICAAVAGRVPKCGLHLKENRAGQMLVRLVDIDPELVRRDDFYPVLGHLVGSAAGEKIPVIEGLPSAASDDQLKALGAAAASSGAVALFHAVGVTPEAPTAGDAFQGGEPERTIEVRMGDLLDARSDLSTGPDETEGSGGAKVDVIVLGCPHFSFAEFRKLAELVRGGRCHPDVTFLVATGQTSYSLLQRSEHLDALTDFGVRITLDTCVFHTPIVGPRAKVLMTDSGKCSYYAPGELDVQVVFGSVADCVASAVAGRVCREESPWTRS